MRHFVVAACGRSGTMGTARLLNLAGIRTSFEEFFDARAILEVGEFPSWLASAGTVGEVSALAAPHLNPLPGDVVVLHPEIVVLHQVRNPMAVVASILGRETYTESLWAPHVKHSFRYVPEMELDSTPLVLALTYWVHWNAMIESRANYRYRVEDLADPGTGVFGRILSEIDQPGSPRTSAAFRAYEPAYNSGVRDEHTGWEQVSDGDLKELVAETAARYGYSVQELQSYNPSEPAVLPPGIVLQPLPRTMRSARAVMRGTPYYLPGLIAMYDRAEANGKVGIEVGSAYGESAEVAAQILGRLYCVDSWPDGAEEVEAEFDRRMAAFGNIIKMKELSHRAAGQFPDESVDLVYIDAAHDVESVRQDILAWFPKVRMGGFVCGHDYDDGPDALHPGVKQAVDEVLGAPFGRYDDTSWLFQKDAELVRRVELWSRVSV